MSTAQTLGPHPEATGDDRALEAFHRSRSALERATRAVAAARPPASQELGAELRSSLLLLASVLVPILLLALAARFG